MKLFDPSSPLLSSISNTFQRHGMVHRPVFRIAGTESTSALWSPKLKYGPLCYDSTTNCWEQYIPSPDREHLMIDAISDGTLRIRPADDEGVYVTTTINAGDEVPELLEFYEAASADKIGTSSYVTRSLASVVDGVYLLVPQGDLPRLLLLDGRGLPTSWPDLSDLIDSWFKADFDRIVMLAEQDLDALIDKLGIRASLPLVEMQEGDFIVHYSRRFTYSGMYLQGAESEFYFGPCLVIRLRSDISRMWFYDYLQHAMESTDLVASLFREWKAVPQLLKSIQIEMPSLKRDQIAFSIAIRESLSTYRAKIRSLSEVREPFADILPLYKQRIAAVDAIHNDLLDDICSMQSPLPFFLEYPYRCFRRESDQIKKIRAGQRLLGVLVKIPLFLMTEELLEAENSLGRDVLAKLEERPLSDGAFVDLQEWTARELGKIDHPPTLIFRRILSGAGQHRTLRRLVTARNRMHHEPYDDIGFISAVSVGAKSAMESLRDALSGCRFIIPIHGRVTNGRKTISAVDISSSDAQFSTVDIDVDLPIESFPCDELVVWCKSPEAVIKLGRLVKSKTVSHQSRDFGIFDRIEKNERVYTYLRTGGGGEALL